jgi:flagellar hook protein FlgE
MSFNTGLSGIRAANTDLSVTGNNIANAGTIGFKSSRAEFGDVYTSSLLGGGSTTPGSGVTTLALRQGFSQGNLKFTQNAMDLAVNGSGFFVMNDSGNQLYTRAGAFGLDKDGYIVGSTGALLQGFAADANGNVSGILGNLKVDVSTQAPRQTTAVNAVYNVDANQKVLESIGASFVSDGNAIGLAQQAIKVPEITTSDFGAITIPALGIDFAANPTVFTISIDNTTPLTGVGEQTITLNATTVTGNVMDVKTLAGLINSQIYESTTPINVQAAEDPNNPGNLIFIDATEGAASTISLTWNIADNATSGLVPNFTAITPSGVEGSNSVPGVPSVTNGYAPQTLVITGPTGADVTYVSKAGDSAMTIASGINALTGVSATATTTATILGAAFTNPNNNLEINDIRFSSQNLTDLARDINALSKTSLSGISATLVGTDLVISSTSGVDLKFSYNDKTKDVPPLVLGDPLGFGGTLNVIGAAGSPTQSMPTAVTDPNSTVNGIVVGGTISVVMDANYSIKRSIPVVGNIFSPFNAASFTPVVMNSFDPNDQKTYNHATSSTIYDSLGNSHVMRSYFVKEKYDANDPTTSPNHWKMYVQIDGKNVGDPDPLLPAPQNILPTMAEFNVHYNQDGTLNTALTDNLLVSNWTPLGADGKALGALPPLNVVQGGAIPVVEPPASSNFVIDLTGSTQFGSVFSVENLDQNGYTTGRLAGLDVDAKGILFARFTNGEAQTLGQVALANFNNIEGLKPVGNTMWAQTFETGEAVIGAPGSSSLGDITSGALEESNVDLSEELVNLIIAQRNYQANAKTIETANATTQTIINLR